MRGAPVSRRPQRISETLGTPIPESLLLSGRYARRMELLLLLAIVALVILYRLLKKSRASEQAALRHAAATQHHSSSQAGSLAASNQYHQQSQAHIRQLEEQIRQMTQEHQAELERRAGRAVAASRGSFDGHVAQQAFPYATSHTYNPKDIFHMGGVMDYVVFDGLHDVRHNGRDPRTLSVVLVDVKWGNSRTSDVQQAVMTAMTEGRTRAEVWQARATPTNELNYNRRTA